MNRKLVALLCLVASVVCVILLNRPTTPLPVASAVREQIAPSSASVTAKTEVPAGLRAWAANPSRNLQEGRQLALDRREQMAKLMRKDPAAALAQSLSWAEWLALPDDIRGLVERPFSDTVDFEVLPNCPPLEGAINQIHPHHIVMGGEAYDGYVFGLKSKMTSKKSMPANGIVLDHAVVLADASFERIRPHDLPAVSQIFPRESAAGVSWTSGRPVGAEGRTILLGGALYDLASDDEESALADALLNAERSLHPKSIAMALTAGTGTIAFSVDAAKKEAQVANSLWTETSKRMLAVRLSYSSAPTSYSFALTDLTNLCTQSSNYVRTISYGKTWLVPTITTVDLPNDQAYYESNGPDAIVNDTRAALSARGVNPANYDIIVHVHPQSGGPNFGYAGLGVIGGGTTWVNGTVDANVLTHEIGHNYGLGHAHSWVGLTGLGALGRIGNDGSQVEKEEYGDPFDVMGGGPLPAAHYGAHGKAALNWIEPQEVINATTNGIYRVFRFDYIGARTNANTKLALKVVAPGGEEYWVSHRKLFTSNTSMSRGAYIVRADGSADQSVIDTTPLSKPTTSLGNDRTDAALAIGKSFVDSVGSVRITTIAAGGVSPFEYLDVQVAFTPDTASYTFYTGADFNTNGLVGSYINSDLRSRAAQEDWRSTAGVTVAGKRIDSRLSFTSDGWGARAPLKLTGGTDANWDNFSVQWDGYIVVRRPIRLATISDDSSRFWIDLDHNNAFSAAAPEFVNNHWGTGQGPTLGDISTIVQAGTYRVRIQYEEGNGGNYFTMAGTELPFQLFTTAARTTPGLSASFVAKSLRTYTTQNDWRTSQTISGSRVDQYPVFKANGWGSLASVGLTANGTDGNWDNFSVQWDGYISNSVPIKLGTVSDDSSRLWIDVNTNGTFSTTAPEYFNNGWNGAGQGATEGAISGVIPPGFYPIRIQYEEGGGDNSFVLAGVPQFPPDAATIISSLTFSGTTQTTTPRKVAGDFTIEFWLRTSQIADTESALVDATAPGQANDFGVSLLNGKILFGVGGPSDTIINSDAIADDQWHYVSARRVQSSGEITLLIDGIPVDRAVGSTALLDGVANISIGAAADGSRGFVGTMDQLRIWDTVRTDQQILADFHSSRTGRWTDGPPLVRLAQLQPNSIQVFWDAISSFRVLEGATTIDGTFVPLLTDQNSTNIPMGANAMRFFRVRK
jgi:hypothetical protein